MAKFNITYYVNNQTVGQRIEAENAEQVKDEYVIKESKWITDSQGRHVYINFEKIDTILITPFSRQSADRQSAQSW